MKTIVVILLDESLSMKKKKSEVIGGFNVFLKEQKKLKNDKSRFYLIKFNSNVNIVYSGVPITEVPELKPSHYVPAGRTALFDALKTGIHIADKDKSEEERVICVIITDGEENSSRETTKEQIRKYISGYESKGDWAFIYIGKNPDRWTKDVGMSSTHGIHYNYNEPRASFKHVNYAVTKYRCSKIKQKKNLFNFN